MELREKLGVLLQVLLDLRLSLLYLPLAFGHGLLDSAVKLHESSLQLLNLKIGEESAVGREIPLCVQEMLLPARECPLKRIGPIFEQKHVHLDKESLLQQEILEFSA